MPVPPSALRDQFLIDPDVVFLNHGSFGACPRPVFEAYQRWQLELERQPAEFLGRRYLDLMAEARAALAATIGAQANDLVYVPNATTGVNIVARSLDLGPGDEVVGTDHVYGGCDRVWRFLCGKSGATYRRASLPVPVTTHAAAVESIWSTVTERTRVLFLDHITSATGLILPVAELCARAREAGIITLIDGAHAPGQIPLDVTTLGADFYTGNCHKWLCAPKGAAFLHARPEAQHLLEPLVVSWGWDNEWEGTSPFIDEHEYTGTRDIAAYLAVPAAIAFQAEHDWPAVRERCHALVREARRRLLALDGVTAIHPDDPAWYAQMEAVALPPCDAAALQVELYERFKVEVVGAMWNDRPLLRLAVQGYNTEADVDALMAGLSAVLDHRTHTA